ncbi:MAG: hypothetical protein IT434_13395 [Phycisphaerales bacterium]|jgi:hypothetical protein|nr:hypothetical protein [Phycisphaerales bacterium]
MTQPADDLHGWVRMYVPSSGSVFAEYRAAGENASKAIFINAYDVKSHAWFRVGSAGIEGRDPSGRGFRREKGTHNITPWDVHPTASASVPVDPTFPAVALIELAPSLDSAKSAMLVADSKLKLEFLWPKGWRHYQPGYFKEGFTDLTPIPVTYVYDAELRPSSHTIGDQDAGLPVEYAPNSPPHFPVAQVTARSAWQLVNLEYIPEGDPTRFTIAGVEALIRKRPDLVTNPDATIRVPIKRSSEQAVQSTPESLPPIDATRTTSTGFGWPWILSGAVLIGIALFVKYRRAS